MTANTTDNWKISHMGLLDAPYLDAIKGFEGYSPNAAWDYKQSSSGYGTRAQPGDENIPPDQLRSIHEQRFQDEIAKASDHVDNINPNLPPGAKAALTSLTYNAGPGWSQSGLGDMVRSGDLAGAAAKMLEYNKAGGAVNPGLVRRRQQEAAWFEGGLPASQPQTASASPASPPSTPLPPQAAKMASAIMGAPQQPTPVSFSQAVGVPQAPAESPPMTEPQMTLPPIFMPPRKQIDLSGLRAALAQAFHKDNA